MSILVDYDDNALPGNVEQLKKELAEDAARSNPSSDKDTSPEDDLPEKYRGKSLRDVVEMHRNAEAELGRKGNELGQYKSLTDRLLELKRTEDLAKGGATADEIEEEVLPEISATDLLDNPTQTVSKLWEAKEKSAEKRRQREAEKAKKQEMEAEFASKHPDAGEIAQDSKFIEWVKSDPARTYMVMTAAQGDLYAGDLILQEWKSRQHSSEEPPKVKKPIEEARKAATERTGQSHTPDAPSGKTYRRLDLIRLKLSDPEMYGDEAFQREIMRAYAEGRVK